MRRVPPGTRFSPVLLALAALCAAPAPLAAQAPIAPVSGVVRNEQGEAIPGAAVVAENGRATPHMFTATTDGRGTFALVGLQPGVWNFSASAPGYLLAQAQLHMSRGGTPKRVELVLRNGPWGPRAAREREDVLDRVDVFRLQTAVRNADTLLGAGQYDQAIAAYQDVLRRLPALTLINLQIGNAWRMKKDYDRAVAAYRVVLATEPDEESAMEALGATELERGRLDAAEEILATSAHRPKPRRSTLCTLGDVKAAQGQPEAAADWYRKASAADPAWVKPVLKLGLLASDARDQATAVGLLERVVRMAPDSPEAAAATRALDELKKR